MRGSCAIELWMKKLRAYIAAQRTHREFYYVNCRLSDLEFAKVLTIIHEKMDHSKTASPHFSHKNKAVDSFIKLLVAMIGIIAHGHGNL
jgi:hypothetical protein